MTITKKERERLIREYRPPTSEAYLKPLSVQAWRAIYDIYKDTVKQYSSMFQMVYFTHEYVPEYLKSVRDTGGKIPTTLQEIPELLRDHPEYGRMGKSRKATAAVQVALEIARQLGLLTHPDKLHEPAKLAVELGVADEIKKKTDLPLRRIWYAFVKLVLQNYMADIRKKEMEKPDQTFYSSFGKLIKTNPEGFWYEDFGILTESKLNEIRGNTMFPPILVGVEKTSYFDVLKNMCELLGLNIYASGGEPSFSASEKIIGNVVKRMPEDQKELKIYTITDFDPAGFDIAKSFGEQANIFLTRHGKEEAKVKRIAPLPEHYTDEELKRSLYTVKNPTKKSWNPSKAPENLYPGINDTLDAWRKEYKEKHPELTETYIHDSGLEIESIPDEPLPGQWDEDYIGVARMRFILFDKLIEDFGVDGAFRYLLEQSVPSGHSLSRRFINTEESDRIVDTVDEIKEPIDEISGIIDNWFEKYIEENREILEKDIDRWAEDAKRKWEDETHEKFDREATEKLKDDILKGLREAIAKDKTYLSISFPEEFKITDVLNKDGIPYPEDFVIEVPPTYLEPFRPLINWALCMKRNAEAVKDIFEEIDSRERPLVDVGELEFEVRPCEIVQKMEEVEEYNPETGEYEKTFRETGELEAVFREPKHEPVEKRLQLPGPEGDCCEELEECEDRLGRCKMSVTALKERIREHQERRFMLAERLKELSKGGMAEEERAKLIEIIDDLETEIDRLYEELEGKNEEIEKLESDIKTKTTELERHAKTYEQEKGKLLKEIEKLKEELVYSRKMKVPTGEINRLKKKLDDCMKKLTALTKKQATFFKRKYTGPIKEVPKERPELRLYRGTYNPFEYIPLRFVLDRRTRPIHDAISYVLREKEELLPEKREEVEKLLAPIEEAIIEVDDPNTPENVLRKKHEVMNDNFLKLRDIFFY